MPTVAEMLKVSEVAVVSRVSLRDVIVLSTNASCRTPSSRSKWPLRPGRRLFAHHLLLREPPAPDLGRAPVGHQDRRASACAAPRPALGCAVA